MINSCKFTAGYPLKLPALQDRTFEFKPGINFLFGPNACGKSTIIRALATYSGIKSGGWTSFQDPLDLANFGERSKIQLPKGYKRLVRDAFEAEVTWDGTPTMLYDSRNSDAGGMAYLFENAEESHDGITTMEDQLQTIFGKPSAGQQRLIKLIKILQMLKNPPKLEKAPMERCNDTWQNCYDAQKAYFKSLPRTGPVTILLDEPESSLDIMNQITFWSKIVPRLAGYQTVIATHSIFALMAPAGYNVIDLKPGYFAECKADLEKMKYDPFNL